MIAVWAFLHNDLKAIEQREPNGIKEKIDLFLEPLGLN